MPASASEDERGWSTTNEGEHERACASHNRPGLGRTSWERDGNEGANEDAMSGEYEDTEERYEQGRERTNEGGYHLVAARLAPPLPVDARQRR